MLSLFIVSMLIPIDVGSTDWVQMSAIEANLRGRPSKRLAQVLKGETPGHLIDRFRSTSLSGEPVIGYPEDAQNVLMLVLEGVSLNAMGSGNMPFMSELAKNNLSYPRFIGLQRQTNRGLFSLLCGEYPNFLSIETKSDYYISFGSLRPCMPEILEQNGYRSVFMQGADLGYMSKDFFAKEAGFSEALGNRDYDEAFARSAWGVDD